ncbi:polysaccharide deacetylase family protein [Pseudonocardia sp. GCM10023141]|uniref:polysaccharide deacetylase family protein n=1 Tax=Pseudonocardia sp. GCM10023141 TaxID=3252653 RepID=UPI0036097158
MNRSVASSIRTLVGRSSVAQAAYPHLVKGRLGTERWALSLLERGRSASRPTTPSKRARIVAYHSIGTSAWGVNDVTPADFERHLQIAVDDGWTFATPAEVLARPAEQLLAITFDDGVATVLDNAVPVLRHHGVPATMFVVTGWADGGHENGYAHVLDWKGVTALQDAGMTLASHSTTHPDFGKLSVSDARRELETSRERMRTMLGLDTVEFAIPFGQSANWTAAAQQAATEAGYTTVYAQSVGTRPQGTVARTFITSFDKPLVYRAALGGAFDNWEEWY